MGLGTTELILILVIVLILFGAKKLPEIGSGLARGIKSFRKNISDEPGKDEASQDATKDAATDTPKDETKAS
jgi:sec-independent protein translocase protein TatA